MGDHMVRWPRFSVMNEAEFCDRIDSCFPWMDHVQAVALIELSRRISPEAVFAVLHELARPGRYADAPAPTRRRLLELLGDGFEHPAKSITFAVAGRMIDGEQLSEQEALSAMCALEEHSGMWSALNTVYFSSDGDVERLDAEYERIKARWLAT